MQETTFFVVYSGESSPKTPQAEEQAQLEVHEWISVPSIAKTGEPGTASNWSERTDRCKAWHAGLCVWRGQSPTGCVQVE